MNNYEQRLLNSLPSCIEKDARVTQVDSKQMAIVTLNDGHQLLYSYFTCIAFRPRFVDTWVLDATKYSSTTSKQVSQFRRDKDCITEPREDFIDELAQLLGVTSNQADYIASR